MRLRPAALALVLAALAAALALALVGVAVLDVADEAQADARAAPHGAGGEPGRRDRGLGVRIGEAILGVADARSYLDAVALARAAARPAQPEPAVLRLRAEAEAILLPVVRGDGDPELRSRAANLLGALLFEDAKIVQQNPRRYLEQALGAFQDAVLLDPSNAVAKRNLELLATLPANTRFRREGTSGVEASASPRAPGGY